MRNSQQGSLPSIGRPRGTKSEINKPSSNVRSDHIYTNLSQVHQLKLPQLGPHSQYHQQQVMALENRIQYFQQKYQGLLRQLEIAEKEAKKYSKPLPEEQTIKYDRLLDEQQSLKQKLNGEENRAKKKSLSNRLAIVVSQIKQYQDSMEDWNFKRITTRKRVDDIISSIKIYDLQLEDLVRERNKNVNRLGKNVQKEYPKFH